MEKEKKIHKTKKDRYGNYFEHKNKIKSEQGVKSFSILPHPATLESYEAISPGITERLSEIIVKEQHFRHKVELLHMKSVHNIYKIGQFLSVMLSIALVYITIFISNEHNKPYLASTVCISGFIFLTVTNVFAFRRLKDHNKKK